MDQDHSYSESDLIESDISDSSFHNNNINRMQELDLDANETAVSLRNSFIGDLKDYLEAAVLFMSYFNDEVVVKQSKMRSEFENHQIFKPYANSIKIYSPLPNLYFLPTTILFDSYVNLQDIRDKIFQSYQQNVGVLSPNERPRELEVTLRNLDELSFYILKKQNNMIGNGKQKHKLPELLEKDLSINVLYNLYSKCYNDNHLFDDTCGIFLYWAYQRKLLTNDYLSESAIKMLVIFLFINNGEGITNLVYSYLNQEGKREELANLKKMYRINRSNQSELDPELFKEFNFSLKNCGKGLEINGKETKKIEILTVPFPVTAKEIEEPINKHRNARDLKSPSIVQNAVLKFKMMMEILEKNIKNSSKIIIDLKNYKQGNKMIENETNFNLEIMHPIFNENICSSLTQDPSKILYLKNEIFHTVNIFRNFKDRPLESLCLIFSKKE